MSCIPFLFLGYYNWPCSPYLALGITFTSLLLELRRHRQRRNSNGYSARRSGSFDGYGCARRSYEAGRSIESGIKRKRETDERPGQTLPTSDQMTSTIVLPCCLPV
ncbi:hypothetical protein R6Q59_008459 [Mikania micrantha]